MGAATGDDAAVWRLDDARALVVTTDFLTPVVDEKQAADKQLLALFKAKKTDAEASKAKAKVEEEWASKAKANYAKAVELATGAK